MASSSKATALVVTITALGGVVALLPAGCGNKEPESSTYFSRTIAPILTTSCTKSNTGASCHVADPKGNAFGNLDTTSFANVDKRRDLLLDYGPYGQSAFLLKNVDPIAMEIESFDGVKVTVSTDVRHAGGSVLDPTASAYQTLRRWIQNGASENNAGPQATTIERSACTTFIPQQPGFDPTRDPARADFGTFRDRVNPVLKDSCAASNCHGTPSNELFLTCGDSPEQLRWNYHSAQEYLSKQPEQSEILRRPLAPAQGGSFHEGGVIFPTVSDNGYTALLDWARQHGPPQFEAQTPEFMFFARKVQPILAKKGCMMFQCHSAVMFHDYRLRGGTGGAFSLSATKKNYDLSVAQIAPESDDPNASRIIRKNLYRPEVCSVGGCDKATGIAHRGGPLLEDFGGVTANLDLCAKANPAYDYDNGDLDKIPAYCVLAEWIKRERVARKPDPLTGVVYVKRPIPQGQDRPQDFDVYSPGADLRIARLAAGAGGALTASEDKSVTAGCGLAAATADIRRPQVSWDGKKIAFGARSSASEPLAVYEMNADGSACAKVADIAAGPPSQNGLLVHNFDPTYSPPGPEGRPRIVFASTRGNAQTGAADYSGPQRTPADPQKPNSNLYVLEPDPGAPAKNRIRQLTYLLNMERQPSFMSDGRVIFTAEKRAQDFYQLALRRINLDGGDYHPLYAQRATIGYLQASSVVELADKNFATVFSDPGAAHSGGAVAVFNRSIGIDFTSKKPEDYVIDPSVIDPASPSSPVPGFFLRSLSFPDPTSSGRPREATTGSYATPSPLPDGRMLVSFGAATDAATFGGDYDVYVMDPIRGGKTKLLGDAGTAEVEAAAIYTRVPRPIFASALDEPNGHTVVYPGKSEAEITVLSVPVFASLLFQNTPTGRVVEKYDYLEIYEDMPPPLEVTSNDNGGANVATDAYGKVYVRRRLLGRAPLAEDGSVKVRIPGGLPVLLKVPDTDLSRQKNLPRFQRESIHFAPGEYGHQSFTPKFFDSLCGACHSSISGRPLDVVVKPDLLTQASRVAARDAQPIDANVAPAQRGPILGPLPR